MFFKNRNKSRNKTPWGNSYAFIPESMQDSVVIEDAKSIVDFILPQKEGQFTSQYSFWTREYVLNLILFFYAEHQKFPKGDICIIRDYYWRSPPCLDGDDEYGRKIYLHEIRKGRNYDAGYWVKIPSLNQVKRSEEQKVKINLWSSEDFLNKYFYQLEFNEPYSKATGSIAGGWVRNPWDGKMQEIVFHFIKDYVKKHKKLPEGEHKFNIDWDYPNAKWLKKVLLKKQVVTFPKLSEVQHG